jgi:hypothetical protein
MTKASRRGRVHMARGSLVLLTALSLYLPAVAAAAPAVTLQVAPIPIPGFPGTGNILGAGAEVQARVTISGTEYGGSPSPLTQIVFYAPTGVKLTSTGFATCALAILEAGGPGGCPKHSSAGPPGEGLGVVSFGGERVSEKVTIQGVFIPDGGLAFYVEGRTPTSFQIIEKGYWTSVAAPFGPKLTAEVPLIETVPGADDASVLSFNVRIGAAYRRGKQTVSYITLPKKCPKGGAPVEMELKFLSGEISTVTYKAPCPKH